MIENTPNSENLTNQTDNSLIPDEKSLRSYWFFFSGQLISLFGSSVVQFALIWWLAVTAKTDPRYSHMAGTILGIASFAGFAPFVLTMLFAGVLVDRWNRKIVIAVSDTVQAIFTGILIILFYFNKAELPYVLVVLAIRGAAQGFHSPATQSIIPLLVPRDKLTKVNSFENIFNSGVNLLGPLLGAFLIEFLGVEQMATILWLDLVTFLIAVIPVLLIHIPDITKEKRESGKGSFRKEFSEGVTFIRKTDGLLTLLVTFTVLNIVTAPVFVLIPLVIKDENTFNASAAVFGTFVILTQVGSLVGGLIMARKPLFKQNVKGVVFGQSISYFSYFLLIISILTSTLWLLLFSAFLEGFTGPFANIPSQTIWQSVVPPKLQGRVMSVRTTIAWLMIPFAQVAGGVLSDYMGILNVYILGFVIGVFFLAYAWFMTALPRVEEILGITEIISHSIETVQSPSTS